jgi:hypothetical protein
LEAGTGSLAKAVEAMNRPSIIIKVAILVFMTIDLYGLYINGCV